MKSHTYSAIFIIAASIEVATTSVAIQASVDKPDKTGLEQADEKVHENTGCTPENPSHKNGKRPDMWRCERCRLDMKSFKPTDDYLIFTNENHSKII